MCVWGGGGGGGGGVGGGGWGGGATVGSESLKPLVIMCSFSCDLFTSSGSKHLFLI